MQRILSGIQCSGRIHLGNLFGAVQNWVRLQDKYECFFMIADLHALTTVDINQFRSYREETLLDLMACGIRFDSSCLFIQSSIPAHSQLHLILSMYTPLPWLERIPSYKDKKEEIKDHDMNTYGFLGYPVLQAADILLYQADQVPVGKDQLPHLELTRMIARRMNSLFQTELKEPADLLSQAAVLPGLDGRKMSKSYDNAIYLADSPQEVEEKVLRKMMTDPARKRRTDPGNAEICPVFAYHQLQNTPERCQEIKTACAKADIGCVDCKKEMLKNLQNITTPIYEARQKMKSSDWSSQLESSTQKAQAVANQTLAMVHEKLNL